MAERLNMAREVAALKRMTVKELRGRYVEVFGEATRSGNKDWLWKRIAWRMQANAEGGLSERARRRARDMTAEPPKITALTPAQVAKNLTAAGNRRITEAMVRADIDAGAPTNGDGTINLVHFAAWLVKEMSNRGD